MGRGASNRKTGYVLVNQPPIFLLHRVSLRQGRNVVGRASTCSIHLPDVSVSREHAEICVDAAGIRVQDLGSLNGTFVDDNPVKTAGVSPGQQLRFGRISFALANGETAGAPLRFDDVSTEKVRLNHAAGVAKTVRSLTRAQRRVLNLLLEGCSAKESARRLCISPHTVHNHLRRIYAAFNVHSRSELLANLLERPLLPETAVTTKLVGGEN